MTYCIAYPYLGDSKPVYQTATPEAIIERSLKYFDIPKPLMFGKTKRREISEPRQMVMVALTDITRLGVASVGRMFERDHATVIHAKKVVRQLCETDPNYLITYNQYLNYLNK